jgi:hypothetical protein
MLLFNTAIISVNRSRPRGGRMDAVSRELVRNRAMLTIMHRVNNLEQHDEIIVLDGGRVVERGSHERQAGTPACSRPA